MALTIDDYRSKLISNILASSSQADVRLVIEEAMTALEQKKVHGFIITRFVDKMIQELEGFSPMDKDSSQWSNIKMARVQFHQIREKVEPGAVHNNQ